MSERAKMAPKLEAIGLTVGFKDGDAAPILRGIDIALAPGRMHGLVGATGCGKSMTAWAFSGLLPSAISVLDGQIMLGEENLANVPEDVWRRVRGSVIGMVFQNPRTALHPMMSVERQMVNILKVHRVKNADDRNARIIDALTQCGISDTKRVASAYPHELSGGLAQRVVIASALLRDPSVLLADEPTTGLDPTIQRQVLDLISELQESRSFSVLMITHNFGIVTNYCTDVSVMTKGSIVETGLVRDVVANPQHDYTARLLAASVAGIA